jgi:hypothetical protein
MPTSLGECPAKAKLRGYYFQNGLLSVKDIFDGVHIAIIRLLLTSHDDYEILKY